MELPNSGYLFTLATLAITFVGFTAIVVILRQSVGSSFLPIDAVVARLFMVWGFAVTYGSLVPVALAAFELKAATIWRVSSVVIGVALLAINLGYPLLRHRATGEATPLHVWLHVGAAIAIVLLLGLDAFDLFPRVAPAIYIAALTLYLVQASFAFVQHFGFMLEDMGSNRGKPSH